MVIARCNETMMPLLNSKTKFIDEESATQYFEEERRLVYVAMSRASKKIIVTMIQRHSSGDALVGVC